MCLFLRPLIARQGPDYDPREAFLQPGQAKYGNCVSRAIKNITRRVDVRVCSQLSTAHHHHRRKMSSSEAENFDMDVSGTESEDYAPAPKKTKAAPKSKAALKPKVPAKPKATKKKVLADKDDNASDKDDSDDEPGSSEPLAPTNAKKKTASETYTKVSGSQLDGPLCTLTPWIALATGAHFEETRLLYRKRRGSHPTHVGMGFG